MRVQLGDMDCAARMKVIGARADVLVASPYELDISKWDRAGDNDIEVLVHNTLRIICVLCLPTSVMRCRPDAVEGAAGHHRLCYAAPRGLR